MSKRAAFGKLYTNAAIKKSSQEPPSKKARSDSTLGASAAAETTAEQDGSKSMDTISQTSKSSKSSKGRISSKTSSANVGAVAAAAKPLTHAAAQPGQQPSKQRTESSSFTIFEDNPKVVEQQPKTLEEEETETPVLNNTTRAKQADPNQPPPFHPQQMIRNKYAAARHAASEEEYRNELKDEFLKKREPSTPPTPPDSKRANSNRAAIQDKAARKEQAIDKLTQKRKRARQSFWIQGMKQVEMQEQSDRDASERQESVTDLSAWELQFRKQQAKSKDVSALMDAIFSSPENESSSDDESTVAGPAVATKKGACGTVRSSSSTSSSGNQSITSRSTKALSAVSSKTTKSKSTNDRRAADTSRASNVHDKMNADANANDRNLATGNAVLDRSSPPCRTTTSVSGIIASLEAVNSLGNGGIRPLQDNPTEGIEIDASKLAKDHDESPSTHRMSTFPLGETTNGFAEIAPLKHLQDDTKQQIFNSPQNAPIAAVPSLANSFYNNSQMTLPTGYAMEGLTLSPTLDKADTVDACLGLSSPQQRTAIYASTETSPASLAPLRPAKIHPEDIVSPRQTPNSSSHNQADDTLKLSSGITSPMPSNPLSKQNVTPLHDNAHFNAKSETLRQEVDNIEIKKDMHLTAPAEDPTLPDSASFNLSPSATPEPKTQHEPAVDALVMLSNLAAINEKVPTPPPGTKFASSCDGLPLGQSSADKKDGLMLPMAAALTKENGIDNSFGDKKKQYSSPASALQPLQTNSTVDSSTLNGTVDRNNYNQVVAKASSPAESSGLQTQRWTTRFANKATPLLLPPKQIKVEQDAAILDSSHTLEVTTEDKLRRFRETPAENPEVLNLMLRSETMPYGTRNSKSDMLIGLYIAFKDVDDPNYDGDVSIDLSQDKDEKDEKENSADESLLIPNKNIHSGDYQTPMIIVGTQEMDTQDIGPSENKSTSINNRSPALNDNATSRNHTAVNDPAKIDKSMEMDPDKSTETDQSNNDSKNSGEVPSELMEVAAESDRPPFKQWTGIIAGMQGTVINFQLANGDWYQHPSLPPGWTLGVSRSKNRPYYSHPDFGRSYYPPVILPGDEAVHNVPWTSSKDIMSPVLSRSESSSSSSPMLNENSSDPDSSTSFTRNDAGGTPPFHLSIGQSTDYTLSATDSNSNMIDSPSMDELIKSPSITPRVHQGSNPSTMKTTTDIACELDTGTNKQAPLVKTPISVDNTKMTLKEANGTNSRGNLISCASRKSCHDGANKGTEHVLQSEAKHTVEKSHKDKLAATLFESAKRDPKDRNHGDCVGNSDFPMNEDDDSDDYHQDHDEEQTKWSDSAEREELDPSMIPVVFGSELHPRRHKKPSPEIEFRSTDTNTSKRRSFHDQYMGVLGQLEDSSVHTSPQQCTYDLFNDDVSTLGEGGVSVITGGDDDYSLASHRTHATGSHQGSSAISRMSHRSLFPPMPLDCLQRLDAIWDEQDRKLRERKKMQKKTKTKTKKKKKEPRFSDIPKSIITS
ncbi:hypothetical protein MPSEU_000854400 [Mayamaea pseudoterrestris]|nr:hypothetical protein MPSEU_000854400 [Mayamaea pseudoterrestris]